MNTEEINTIKKKRNKFFLIAVVTLLILAVITTVGDIINTNHSCDTITGILFIPVMPGFFIYVFTTGDIHGWQPGPIGQAGRIIVCTLGSWVFWTPIVWWVYFKIQTKK